MKYCYVPKSKLNDFKAKYPNIVLSLEVMIKNEFDNKFTFEYYKLFENGATDIWYIFIFDNNEIVASLRYYIKITDKIFDTFNVPKNEYIHITDVIVSLKYRRKGICSKMISKLLDKHTGKHFVLRVEKKNIGAIKCYEKLKFKKVDVINDIILMNFF